MIGWLFGSNEEPEEADAFGQDYRYATDNPNDQGGQDQAWPWGQRGQ